jgi:hypothetical protein
MKQSLFLLVQAGVLLSLSLAQSGVASRTESREENKSMASTAATGTHGSSTQQVPPTTEWAVWDDKCTVLYTPPIGGDGPMPESHGSWGLPGTPGIKCLLGAKTYRYEDLGTLTVIECADNTVEATKHTKYLDEIEMRDVEKMLRGLKSTRWKRSGEPIPADGSLYGPEWFSVERGEEVRTFVNTNPGGQEDPKYTYGTRPDLGFLKKFDELVGLGGGAPTASSKRGDKPAAPDAESAEPMPSKTIWRDN